MSKQKQCIDFYGERLKVGDEVIPILDEALIIGISGAISKIEYISSGKTESLNAAVATSIIAYEGVRRKMM